MVSKHATTLAIALLAAIPFAGADADDGLAVAIQPTTPTFTVMDAPRTHCRFHLADDGAVTELGCLDFTVGQVADALRTQTDLTIIDTPNVVVPSIPVDVAIETFCDPGVGILELLEQTLSAAAACVSPSTSGVLVVSFYEHIKYNNDPNNPGGRSAGVYVDSKCVRDVPRGIPDLGRFNWNDIISSAKTHTASGCRGTNYYPDTNYSNIPDVGCIPNCDNMVSMGFNDRASSNMWFA